MSHAWRFLLGSIASILLTACSPSSDFKAISPIQNSATSTVTPPIATSTPRPDTHIATRMPGVTHTPTALPPSPIAPIPMGTQAPFLPEGLAQIEASNINRLRMIGTLPVKEIYELVF